MCTICTFRVCQLTLRVLHSEDAGSRSATFHSDALFHSCGASRGLGLNYCGLTIHPLNKVSFGHALFGAGKSVLSTTIANQFRRAQRLGAFVLFDRDVSHRNDLQMASHDRRIKTAIIDAIDPYRLVCNFKNWLSSPSKTSE